MHLVSSQTARHKDKLVDHVDRQSDKPTEIMTEIMTGGQTVRQQNRQTGQ